MDYLTAEEIRNSEAVKNRNKQFAGPAVRHGFAIGVVNKYILRISAERERA